MFKEFGKIPVMPMLLPLKKNITNNLRTRRTRLELLDGFKNLEVSFTIHQLPRDTMSSPKRKKRRKNLQTKLSHSPHLNLINKRKIP